MPSHPFPTAKYLEVCCPSPDWQCPHPAVFVQDMLYSSSSIYITAEESLHFIMGTEPERVIEAILWVVDQARAAESGE